MYQVIIHHQDGHKQETSDDLSLAQANWIAVRARREYPGAQVEIVDMELLAEAQAQREEDLRAWENERLAGLRQ